MRSSFLVLLFLLLKLPLLAEDDIIQQVASHPHGSAQAQQADGSMREVKYGDYGLEQAGIFLTGRYPHPWTVSKTLGWFREASDPTTRVHLLRVLAASRDPKAALVLGDCFHDPSLGIDACEDMNEYFVVPQQVDGGSRSVIAAATKWFAANKERLQREAR